MLALLGARPRVALAVTAERKDDGSRSRKGKQFEGTNRRRGRPAWKRTPDDTPLRDGNRDRLIGLLTERAAKTLMIYLMELNPTHYSWLVEFYKVNPIPKVGTWDDVSGEAFLRKLLSMPIEAAIFKTGREDLYSNVKPMGVDPRNLAMRILDIRSQLAKEFIQDLSEVAEENSTLMRETLKTSLLGSDAALASSSDSDASAPGSGSATPHPEVVEAVAAARAAAEAEAAAARAAEEARERQQRADEAARAERLAEQERARREAEARAALEASFGRAMQGDAAAGGGAVAGEAEGVGAAPAASGGGGFAGLGADAAAVVAALNAAFRREASPDVGGAGHPDVESDGSGSSSGGSVDGGGDAGGGADGGGVDGGGVDGGADGGGASSQPGSDAAA
ncbi:hypothetical protein Rsub_02543 [Raphidocelis subcapitata]|uniref:Uncharacterized protein n=1 Tax=Raphidocelis subcapitata TaxID=307507 RepID=A0A2V0NR97_9CHLO|nr:hypothetical protein Rsub_02543 [Raphidocelis subcapitata]|eukprot:GBF89839.1 hypothetical protein Rsub_02543 [Raphidocelis subcapitata]